MIEKLKKQLKQKSIKIRLWKCSPDDIKDEKIIEKYANLSHVSKEIPGIGELIETDIKSVKSPKLEELGMKPDQFFIV